MIWSVVVSDALKAVVEPPPNKFLASEAEPDNAANDELIVWSVVVSDADKGVTFKACDEVTV